MTGKPCHTEYFPLRHTVGMRHVMKNMCAYCGKLSRNLKWACGSIQKYFESRRSVDAAVRLLIDSRCLQHGLPNDWHWVRHRSHRQWCEGNWERATLRGRYKTESGRQPSTQLIILISSSSSTRQRQLNSTRGGNSGTCGMLLLRLHCTQKSTVVAVASALPTHKHQQQQTASNKLRLFCKTKLWLPFGCCFSFFFWFSNLNLKLNVLLSSSPSLSLSLCPQHGNTLCQVAQQRRVKFDWTKYAMRHVVCSPVLFFSSMCVLLCVCGSVCEVFSLNAKSVNR